MTTKPAPGMPTHAYLICTECRLSLLLGESTAGPDRTLSVITQGMYRPPQRGRPVHHKPTAALWRLITEHAGHVLRVVAECWPEFDTYNTIDLAGIYPALPHERPAATPSDITLEAYAWGWPHRPAVLDYRGATPAPGQLPRRDDKPASVSQFCLTCRIAVDLGDTVIQPDGTATRFTVGSTRRDSYCDATVNTALLRLLIDHAGHDLLAVPLDSTAYENYINRHWVLHVYRDADRIELRGEITWAQYIEGWPDAPVYSRHHGIFPVARRGCAAGGRIHHGCHHPHPPRPLNLDDTPAPAHHPAGHTTWLRRLIAAIFTDGEPGPQHDAQVKSSP